jgi:hypothetical protein
MASGQVKLAACRDKMAALQGEMASLEDKMAACQDNGPLLRLSGKGYERLLRCINRDMNAGHKRFQSEISSMKSGQSKWKKNGRHASQMEGKLNLDRVA